MISIRKDIDTGFIFPDGFPLQKPFASYLETDVDPKYYLSKAESEYMSRKVKGGRTHFDFRYHHDTDNETCSCLTANIHKGVP